jgi:transaldolase
VPPATYEAILDHCSPILTLECEISEARLEMEALADMGIDMDKVLERLEADGVAAFEKSFDGLHKCLQAKIAALKSNA